MRHAQRRLRFFTTPIALAPARGHHRCRPWHQYQKTRLRRFGAYDPRAESISRDLSGTDMLLCRQENQRPKHLQLTDASRAAVIANEASSQEVQALFAANYSSSGLAMTPFVMEPDIFEQLGRIVRPGLGADRARDPERWGKARRDRVLLISSGSTACSTACTRARLPSISRGGEQPS